MYPSPVIYVAPFAVIVAENVFHKDDQKTFAKMLVRILVLFLVGLLMHLRIRRAKIVQTFPLEYEESDSVDDSSQSSIIVRGRVSCNGVYE